MNIRKGIKIYCVIYINTENGNYVMQHFGLSVEMKTEKGSGRGGGGFIEINTMRRRYCVERGMGERCIEIEITEILCIFFV
jgi:hypothetical protein